MPKTKPFRRTVVADRLDLRDRPYMPDVSKAPEPSLNSLKKHAVSLAALNQLETNACTGFALARVVDFPAPAGATGPRASRIPVHALFHGPPLRRVPWLEKSSGLKTAVTGGAPGVPLEDWDLLDERVLGALLAGRAEEVMREALECRRLLEGEAAAEAARRIRPDGPVSSPRRSRACAAGRRRAAGRGRPRGRCRRVRAVLARLSGNRPLGRMLAPLDAVSAAVVRELPRSGRRRLVERYEKILSAVFAGDADGAREAVEADVAATAAAVAPSGRRRGGR